MGSRGRVYLCLASNLLVAAFVLRKRQNLLYGRCRRHRRPSLYIYLYIYVVDIVWVCTVYLRRVNKNSEALFFD